MEKTLDLDIVITHLEHCAPTSEFLEEMRQYDSMQSFLDKGKIRNVANFIFFYCYYVLNGDRWIELEKYLLRDEYFSYLYCLHIIRGRWLEAERVILASSPIIVYLYATDVYRGRWPEGKNVIRKNKALFKKLYG